MNVIYQIRNLTNGKIYIGSAVNDSKRLNNHLHGLHNGKHHNKYLQSAWNKQNGIRFVFEIIEIVKDKSKLIEREQFWLDRTRCYDRKIGYNFRLNATSNAGLKFSDEHKAKLSKARKGKTTKGHKPTVC